MNNKTYFWLRMGLWALLAFLVVWGYTTCRKEQEDKDATRKEQISQAEREGAGLKRQDSVSRHAFDSVSLRLDSMSRLAVHGLDHWDTVTKRVVVTRRDTVQGKEIVRVDSVFKDSAFARLPDSLKVQVLRQLGDQNVKACRELVSTCLASRDSARSLLNIKDSLIANRQHVADLWEQRFKDKPRRRCGIGFTLGIIGGVSSTLAPVSGVGGAAGISCSL